MKVHGLDKEHPVTQSQFMKHYDHLESNFQDNKNKSLFGFINDLERIANNKKVRILLPKWVSISVFIVFYEYLTLPTHKQRHDYCSKLLQKTHKSEQDLDIIQKLFWIAHLFELKGLKEALDDKNQNGNLNKELSNGKIIFPQHIQCSNLMFIFYLDFNKKQEISQTSRKLIMSNEKENTSVISFEDAPLPIASIKPLPREEVKTKIDFSQT